ncbi:MAG: NUDIX hydrolase [Verrucomicrobia bacterium]|nr:NUDIX hydrolase [Verrucomicrobiota bacterium]
MSPTPPAVARARISGVVLLREDGASLLQHRDDKPGLSAAGQWVFPGGHCEPGETCRDCARREFLEETGYNCEALELLTEFDYLSPDTGREFRLSFWWASYDGVRPVHCFEGQEVRFMTRAEAPRHPMPDYVTRVWDLALDQKKTSPDGQSRLLTTPSR